MYNRIGRNVLLVALFTALAVWAAGALAPDASFASSARLDVSAQETPPPDPDDLMAAWSAWSSLSAEQQAKVDPRLLEEFRGVVRPVHLGGHPTFRGAVKTIAEPQPLERTRFLVYLNEEADLSAVSRSKNLDAAARRVAVVSALRSTAERSQAPARAFLDRQRAGGAVTSYQPFYIVNAIAVEGDLNTVSALAQRADVSRIVANYSLFPIGQGPSSLSQVGDVGPAEATSPDLYFWNLARVNANLVHNQLGILGEGAVVGSFDSGVSYRHPALADAYRGAASGQFDHNYNWFEPDPNLRPSGDFGPSLSQEPYDCDGWGTHGTHTTGTMVGDGGTETSLVGMAPGARWIAVPGICPNTMSGGISDDIGGLKAFQWFLCPTDLSGSLASADCSKAPDVINNSWGSANPADRTFGPVLAALRAAGVAPVFASGNPAAGPGSIGAPANNPEAIAVGATDIDDQIAYFSGRGPSLLAGEQKPELSAPGVRVRSSVGLAGYDEYSGTSMAAPHVAGLIALMVSADLQDGVRDFNVDELERFMELTAEDLGAPGPDDLYGYGRIDAYGAVQLALSAGDMQGRVLDDVTGEPVADAQVLAVARSDGAQFSSRADAQGAYSLTVPGGSYDVTVSAWGYVEASLSGHQVISHALTLADIYVSSWPVADLQGVVRDENGPVAGATVAVAAKPSVQVQTGPDGSYILRLPLGEHLLRVTAPGRRVLEETVRVHDIGSQVDITMSRAPSILLVDTSALSGWFDGWPIYRFFTMALDKEHYLYDLWRIRRTDFQDLRTDVDGSIVQGVPSAETLGRYDVVIWVHSACQYSSLCDNIGAPVWINAEEPLLAYLDQGGRLLLSGQDLVHAGEASTLIKQYVGAQEVSDYAARLGDLVIGAEFLDGIQLPITNASLYGFANGRFDLSPDSVEAAPGSVAYPVMTYGNASARGAAALATAPCDANYRTVLLSVGYENLAPRGYQRQSSWSAILDRSIQWLVSRQQASGFSVQTPVQALYGVVGDTLSYRVIVTNRGSVPERFRLVLDAGAWPTQLTVNGAPAPDVITLGPCNAYAIDVSIRIPFDAQLSAEDAATLHVVSDGASGGQQEDVTLTARYLPEWTYEQATGKFLPDKIAYSGVASGMNQDGFTLLGGWSDRFVFGENDFIVDFPLRGNWRYDACSETWSAGAPLPEARGAAAVAAVGNRIVVAGGDGLQDGNYAVFNSVFLYDPEADRWSTGAPMPVGLTSAAGAGVDGKLYVFGGSNGFQTVDTVWIYDLAADRWHQAASIPGGPRRDAAVAVLGGKIFLAGGWQGYSLLTIDRLDIYDPASDTWSAAAPLPNGRHSGSLVAGPDGMLYLAGGGDGFDAAPWVDRYDPVTNEWTSIWIHTLDEHVGAIGGFAGGKLHLMGGSGVYLIHESLRLTTSFCQSGLYQKQSAVGLNQDLRYNVELYGGINGAGARFTAPLPAGVVFAGFQGDPAGASYNREAHQVEWAGSIAAGSEPRHVGYRVTVKDDAWSPGDRITHTVYFVSGRGGRFTDTAVALVQVPDFGASTKTSSQEMAGSGDRITYTLNLKGRTAVGDVLSLTDVIPPGLRYLPGSLTATAGTGGFDYATGTLSWTGDVGATQTGHVNAGDDYIALDSLTDAELPKQPAEWIDISGTGDFVFSGRRQIQCGLDVGFVFPFYGRTAERFCVDSNGYISFDESAYPYSRRWNDCPLAPLGYSEELRAAVAGLWDDLYVDGGVFVQTLGAAPNRYTVIQWKDTRKWDSWDELFGTPVSDTDFEIVLHEDGRIYVNILRAGDEQGRYSTTGIVDWDGNAPLTYACNQRGSLVDDMTVLFLPPGGVISTPSAQVHYVVEVEPGVAPQTLITNTATVRSSSQTVTMTAPLVVNTIDLSSSAKEVSQDAAQPGQMLFYTITVANTGLGLVEHASVEDVLSQHLVFQDGSLACSSGQCKETDGTITWDGALGRSGAATITYRAQFTGTLHHGAPVTNTATIRDGFGHVVTRTAAFKAFLSDLALSTMRFEPLPADPGDRLVLNALLRNSGGVATDAAMNLPLPAELTLVPGSLHCGIGRCWEEGRRIMWEGVLPPRGLVPVQAQVDVAEGLMSGYQVQVQMNVQDQRWHTVHAVPGGFTIAWHTFMPVTGNGVASPPDLYLPLVGR